MPTTMNVVATDQGPNEDDKSDVVLHTDNDKDILILMGETHVSSLTIHVPNKSTSCWTLELTDRLLLTSWTKGYNSRMSTTDS